jgi:hypothetical protein
MVSDLQKVWYNSYTTLRVLMGTTNQPYSLPPAPKKAKPKPKK